MPELGVILDSEARDPLLDIAIGPAWLRQIAKARGGPVLRVYQPAPTLAFSGRDCLEPGIDAATDAAHDHGFTPVRRGPGGRAVAYHRGCLGIDHIAAVPAGTLDIRDRFVEYGDLLVGVLRSLGVDARLGEVPGEYCPGEFSVNDGHGHKLVGTAQRLVPGGWLFSSMILVSGADEISDVLIPVYDHLGLTWNPATVGAVEDCVADLTVAAVQTKVLGAYSVSNDLRPATVPAEVLADAAAAAARHRVEVGRRQ